MDIHKDQANVATFCELTEFVDSGFQSFREQVTHLTGEKLAEAAFFAGAAMSFKLMQHFQEMSLRQGPRIADEMCGLMMQEINDYMLRNGMRLEWQPHVPRRWKQ